MILDYIDCWSFILCLLNNQETNFNKGLFDLIKNACILDYLSTTIQVNSTFHTVCSIVAEQVITGIILQPK